MVQVAALGQAIGVLKSSFTRLTLRVFFVLVLVAMVYGACTVRVRPHEWGVEQKKFGFKRGIVDAPFGPGIYFVGPGTTMHTFPRQIHVLEASFDRRESMAKAQTMGGNVTEKVDQYFDRRDRLLGTATHRLVDALNIQTSDGYAVTADVTLLYSIADPVKIAREFGWGSLYVDAFVINTFRNGILATLGKLNAESFYDELVRIPAIHESEAFLAARFEQRGFKVERLLLRSFRYADNYEKSLHDKKVAVQLTEKNRKESLVNEAKATLKQIEAKGNADITIAESEVNTKISKIRAEAELYASQVRARADKEINVAGAEAKRLKADALTTGGGRYVVALETAKMFENIDGAVMTPEQYIAFVRAAWALIGVSPGGAPPAAVKK